MRRQDHLLPTSSPGSQRQLSSWHFGQPGARPLVYIQAGLHADELPGMLVAHQLLGKLEALEAAGQILGEVNVVPVANPIGLNQKQMGQYQGRFEVGSGRNFNRGFPDLVPAAARQLSGRLNQDAEHNAQQLRRALRQALEQTACGTELGALQQTLFGLALEADVVLDLHCDEEAVLHLYAHSEQLEAAGVLAACLGAAATLHACEQGGLSFDDACTRQWWLLKQQFSEFPIPMACFATTVELRGKADVDTVLAQQDAENLLRFLRWCGALCDDGRAPPQTSHQPTRLDATEVLCAPCGGVVEYRGQVGRMVRAGEALADIIDPLSGQRHTMHSSASGMYYARVVHRYAHAGSELCYIAGHQPQQRAQLLSD